VDEPVAECAQRDPIAGAFVASPGSGHAVVNVQVEDVPAPRATVTVAFFNLSVADIHPAVTSASEVSITMVLMSAIKEVCARKARRSSVVACGHYVLVGQLIVRIGGRWVCRDCAYTREYGIPWRSAS